VTETSPTPTLVADPLVGTTVAGRYRIEGLLGSGGMGAVYRAEHVHMRKTVALKVLHKEFVGVNEVVARFEREAIAAGRIEHPNVAPATDFGKLDDGSFYLVLEFVDGKSLRQLISDGPIGWERAVGIARQVVSALVAAHAAGIVHRDLKPDNVMLVTQPDGTERVKVLDFGIARVTLSEPQRDATHLTKVGAVMGTVAYMSPEQALGEEVDERTDLYALGVILHEMIAGRVPFDAETAAQILAKQITEAPPPLPPGTPAPLGALVGELLRKTAIERPPSARVVLERLKGIKSGSTVAVATQPSEPRQRRLLFAGIAVAAAAVGIASAVALSGGDERTASPESASPAASGVAGMPSARGSAIGAQPQEPEVNADKDAGVPASKGSASESKPAQSAGTAAPKSGKRRTQGSDSGKKRKGPGGIYIPPPSEWF
jgi:eukaryotic-like serine/threonine-protein kinase